MIILEYLHFQNDHNIVLYARSRGKYDRPILGNIVDLRTEDILPRGVNYMNLIARLPDIPAHGQTNKYLMATSTLVEIIQIPPNQLPQTLERLSAQGYVELPADESSPYWHYTQSPWWEYCMILDQYHEYVKAPKRHRANEPSPDQIDEQLDKFSENHGKLKALGPRSIQKMHQYKSDSYVSNLNRI